MQVLVGPHVQRPSNDQVLVRRTHDLADVVPWQWHGVRVADAARVVVDGTRECDTLRDVRGLVLGAVADGHTDPDALTRLLDNGAVGGTAWARRAVRDAVGGEMDSKEVHGDADALDDTLVRHATFTGAGLSLVHVTPNRYRANPTAFHDRLLAAVADRQRRGLGEPDGLVVTPRGPLLR